MEKECHIECSRTKNVNSDHPHVCFSFWTHIRAINMGSFSPQDLWLTQSSAWKRSLLTCRKPYYALIGLARKLHCHGLYNHIKTCLWKPSQYHFLTKSKGETKHSDAGEKAGNVFRGIISPSWFEHSASLSADGAVAHYFESSEGCFHSGNVTRKPLETSNR